MGLNTCLIYLCNSLRLYINIQLTQVYIVKLYRYTFSSIFPCRTLTLIIHLYPLLSTLYSPCHLFFVSPLSCSLCLPGGPCIIPSSLCFSANLTASFCDESNPWLTKLTSPFSTIFGEKVWCGIPGSLRPRRMLERRQELAELRLSSALFNLLQGNNTC